MTVVDDTQRGTTLGSPDGPMRFIPQFGFEVPTFIDPRDDLRTKDPRGENAVKRCDHHVPFEKRGIFKIYDWPTEYQMQHARQRVDMEGYVLCNGRNAAGLPCARRAVNRSHFCTNHGGGLHLADKKLSSLSQGRDLPQDRIDMLDRPQQFMQGFLSVEALSDDEIKEKFIYNNAGVKVKARALGLKFEQELTKEFHRRINEYLVSKTPKALEVLTELIESDMVEPADRLKAIGMLTDRTMGKPADIILHGTTDKPYESILDSIENGGSREDYRRRVASTRLEIAAGDQPEIQDAEEVDVSYYADDEEISTDDLARSVRIHGNQDQGYSEIPTESSEWNGSGSESDSRDEDDTVGVVDEITRRRAAFKAQKAKIQGAKKKRFAARATGASSLDSIPYGLEFSLIERGPLVGKLRMKLVAPSKMTEARAAKMALVNETTDVALSLLYGNEQATEVHTPTPDAGER